MTINGEIARMNDTVLIGNVDDCLQSLDDNTIDCAVTSPPYWAQRDYEFNGQIGQEETFVKYCIRLTQVFSILRAKLTEKGVFFLNIGDKYLNKYGNTPLGMIPFVLAYYLELDGWFLDDILIWYKVGHMPSSIKNRFTNTYEPVFVLAKNKNNYHAKYREKMQQKGKYSNVLKISLQQTPVKHMAVYPEKLVESVLNRGIPISGTVCDPFTGSGTTGKAVKNLNGYSLVTKEKVNRRTILIEGNKDYLDIILERTSYKKSNVKFVHEPVEGWKYAHVKIVTRINEKYKPKFHPFFRITKSAVKIIDNKIRKEHFFQSMISKEAFETLPDAGIFYFGFKNFTLEDYYHMSQLKDHGWIIRNMIIHANKEKKWLPIFFIVKDQKLVRYKFNLDNIRIQHKTDWEEDWKKIDFRGFEVVDNFSLKDKQKRGMIATVKECYPDGMPRIVLVEWEDKTVSVEYVSHTEDWWDNLEINCPLCNASITEKEEFFYQLKCPKCNEKLWLDTRTLPRFKEIDEKSMLAVDEKVDEIFRPRNSGKRAKKNYNGKFSDAARINLGQSPGARASTQDLLFSVARRYGIDQANVSDLLNFYRKQAGLSKKALTDKFPPDYLHTVGHWLRKDMGGSIPLPEDVRKLAEFIHLPEIFINILTRRQLKLQAVKKAKKGKNPGDFLEGDLKSVLDILNRSMKF
ncbi:MAG: DNA-methyltransferase [Candidatus Hodarchaeales archaeon]